MVDGELASIMFYVMNGEEIAPPNPEYYDRIRQGYVDWGIDEASLWDARRRADAG